MIQSRVRLFCVATVTVILLGCRTTPPPAVTQAAKAPPATVRPAAVLIAGWHTNHELAAKLQAAGFTVNVLGYPGLLRTALTWDQLKQYNVIVVMGLGSANADLSLPDAIKENIALLHRFLNEGGGVFYIPSWGQQNTLIAPQTAFLSPLGLTPLFDEVIFDPDTSTPATAWGIPFASTTNITPGLPLTAGVTSLWYPVMTRAGAQNHSMTFTVDTAWTVAVRGAKTALTRRIPLESYEMSPTAPLGHYTSAPPLLASRTVGKGRLVCFGVTPEYLFAEAGMATLERIVFDRGMRNVPSHGYVLLQNALRWLAEPSATGDLLGGAPMDPKILVDPAKTVFAAPFDWKTGDQQPAAAPAHRGVIGARSAASSGEGNAAEWVKQAKAQGLAYLVFLEEFAKLSREKYEALKKECTRLTTPEFAAIPGFTIDDEVGNHYFYFGTGLAYPSPKHLSKDGSVFVSYNPVLAPVNLPGQLASTTIDYTYTEGGFRLTAGNYLFSQDAAPFANFFSDWDATGVIIARDGQVLEDATQDYLRLIDFGQGPEPLAINLMTDPAQLARCPWQTVLRLPPTGASAVGDTLVGTNKVAAYWDSWHGFPDNPARVYLTSGPEIVRWSYAGSRDYSGDNQGDFVWENLRWKVHGEVKSAVNLKEVAVYDGAELFRRFLPQNQKEFAFTLDLTHDKQHNLVLIVTDVNGGRAISGEQWDRNHRLEELQCGDRNNQLSYGYTTNKDGFGLTIGGNQCLASPSKRIDEKYVSPAGTFRNDPRLGAPAFDGGVGGEPRVFTPPTLNTAQGPIPAPAVSESFRLLHTGDVNIGEGRWDHDFTDNIQAPNVWHTLWKTTPARDYVITKRNHFFNIDPDSPLPVFLWTIKLTLLRDLPNNGLSLGFISGDAAKLWTVRGSDHSFEAGSWKPDDRSTTRVVNAPFNRGAYAAALDSPMGGAVVFPLTDGMGTTLYLPDPLRRLYFNLPAGQTPQKKGETTEMSLLLVGIPRATDSTRDLATSTTETVERFRRDFGLGDSGPAYQVTLTAGKITSQRYLLRVDGDCSGVIEGDLISTLPIVVSGMNDRWSAFLYDRQLKTARPLGVAENQAWATVRVHGQHDLFIGHPVTCDNREVFLQLTQTGASAWHLEVHNPTDAPATMTLRINPFFDALKGKLLPAEPVTVPAGNSRSFNL